MPPRVRLAPALGLLAAAAGLGLAAPGRCALDYDASLGAGVEANDNVRLAPEEPLEGEGGPVGGTIGALHPALRFSWEGGEDRLRVDYAGAVRSVPAPGGGRSTEWYHGLSAELAVRRWAPFFLEMSDELERVPRYRGSRDEDLESRAAHNQLEVRAGLALDASRVGRFEVAARGEAQTFPGEEGSDEVTAAHGEIVARRSWTPLVTTSLRAAFGEVRRELTEDFTEAVLELEAAQRITPRLDASYSLAWSVERPRGGDAGGGEEERAARENLLKGVALTGGLEREGFWRLAYQDRLDTLADGVRVRASHASGSVTLRARGEHSLRMGIDSEEREFLDGDRVEREWGPTGGARWMAREWLALDVEGYWARTRATWEGAPEEEEVLGAGASLLLLLGRHWLFEVGYRHQRGDADQPGASYRNHRGYALLTAFLQPLRPGRLPESVASRIAPVAPRGRR